VPLRFGEEIQEVLRRGDGELILCVSISRRRWSNEWSTERALGHEHQGSSDTLV